MKPKLSVNPSATYQLQTNFLTTWVPFIHSLNKTANSTLNSDSLPTSNSVALGNHVPSLEWTVSLHQKSVKLTILIVIMDGSHSFTYCLWHLSHSSDLSSCNRDYILTNLKYLSSPFQENFDLWPISSLQYLLTLTFDLVLNT